MKKYIIGIDIGGTKCAVLLGRTHGGVEDIITDKLRFETRAVSYTHLTLPTKLEV